MITYGNVTAFVDIANYVQGIKPFLCMSAQYWNNIIGGNE